MNKLILKNLLALNLGLNLFAAEAEAEDKACEACNACGDDKRIAVGGQAVIEGVLMKGPNKWGLAVRKASQSEEQASQSLEQGEIVKESWPHSSRTKRMPYKLPFVRGFVVMCEMMSTGFKALSRSAEIALEETDTQEKLTFKDLLFTVIFTILAVGGLFIALPLYAAEFLAKIFELAPRGVGVYTLEGVIRAVIFIAYIAIIGMWSDIKRVFAYHGAEHKTINAYEGGLEMTPENIVKCSRIHPRCGTSFLLIAVIVSIAVFSMIGRGGFLWRVMSRIILIPVVIGVSYEIIRLAGNSGKLGRAIIFPFLSLQFLTTREPDLSQAEVALASLNTAMN